MTGSQGTVTCLPNCMDLNVKNTITYSIYEYKCKAIKQVHLDFFLHKEIIFVTGHSLEA